MCVRETEGGRALKKAKKVHTYLQCICMVCRHESAANHYKFFLLRLLLLLLLPRYIDQSHHLRMCMRESACKCVRETDGGRALKKSKNGTYISEVYLYGM